MHVHEEVLAAANEIAGQRRDWTFSPFEIVQALPGLNESSVRTHVVSRCCVNAPKNHLHKWDYFRRTARGRYEVTANYRNTSARSLSKGSAVPLPVPSTTGDKAGNAIRREVIHAVVYADNEGCTAECLEVAVVTQGSNLDEVVRNLKDALALHLEGEDFAAMGLAERPRLQITIDSPLAL